MQIAAVVGSILLLGGAFPHYTSRPDLFPGYDQLFSCGGCLSVLAGLWSVGVSGMALVDNQSKILVGVLPPAGFVILQWISSMALIQRVSFAKGVRVGPGLGMILSMLVAVILAVVGFLALPVSGL